MILLVKDYKASINIEIKERSYPKSSSSLYFRVKQLLYGKGGSKTNIVFSAGVVGTVIGFGASCLQ